MKIIMIWKKLMKQINKILNSNLIMMKIELDQKEQDWVIQFLLKIMTMKIPCYRNQHQEERKEKKKIPQFPRKKTKEIKPIITGIEELNHLMNLISHLL